MGVEHGMTHSLRRPALLSLFIVAGLLGLGEIAQADCIGPTFSHTGGDVAHGELITVTGYGFGDNCYDTGPPPPGEGSLGKPLVGIEVYVDQGGERHLVAVGNADQDYAWEVQIPVPAVLDVGDTQIVVMSNGFDAFRENPPEIWVTSDVDTAAEIEVTSFGQAPTDQPNSASEAAFPGTNWTPVITLVASTIAIAALARVLQRRSTRRVAKPRA